MLQLYIVYELYECVYIYLLHYIYIPWLYGYKYVQLAIDYGIASSLYSLHNIYILSMYLLINTIYSYLSRGRYLTLQYLRST